MTNIHLVQALQASIAPCVLISGDGLLLLSLSNRLSRPIERIRHLCDVIKAHPQRDHDAARELSHRMASEASTARNAGMSIGGGRFESASQASMRSQSASMTFPFSSSA